MEPMFILDCQGGHGEEIVLWGLPSPKLVLNVIFNGFAFERCPILAKVHSIHVMYDMCRPKLVT